MIQGPLLHPQILAALGRAGHSSKVLISDGNYPHWTKRGPNAEVVYLNLAPALPTVTDVLNVLVTAIPIEAAHIMDFLKTGPYALEQDPPIWDEFRQIFQQSKLAIDLEKIE